jgi:hypothetical protein
MPQDLCVFVEHDQQAHRLQISHPNVLLHEKGAPLGCIGGKPL